MSEQSKICHLEISSWQGISLGAEHYYAKLICGNRTIELERTLTQAGADALNRKDDPLEQHSWLWRKGHKTTRFDTLEQIRRIAKRIMRKEFPEAKILLVGYASYHEPQPAIVGPAWFVKESKRLHKEAEKLEYYTFKRNYAAMEKIDAEWDALLDKWNNAR